MRRPDNRQARIIASVAATVISLACGTNYVYSAWAPQFAERLKLSATESNLIGLSGNLGMYLMGVPVGLFVDHRGPRPAVLSGAVLLAAGYFPLHVAYNNAAGPVPLLCLYSFLSGFGGCMAFAAAVKTSALNWPHHRGTATAFPLAAFGLSAFFFSLFGSILFPGDTSDLLLLLSCGTFGLTLLGFFFLKIHPVPSGYQAVPSAAEPLSLDRGSSDGLHPSQFTVEASAEPEIGTSTSPSSAGASPTVATAAAATTTNVTVQAAHKDPTAVSLQASQPDSGPPVAADFYGQVEGMDENTPLITSPSLEAQDVARTSVDVDHSHCVDIRGLKLLSTLGFWQLFTNMAILAGVGLMTINNIGNDVKALWKYSDPSVTEDFLIRRQGFHVSILSVGSFLGRLSSGVGSDFLVKRLHASRIWCLVVACLVFLVAQVCALNITNPKHLYFVSTLSGLGYGFLFGVFPSIVAEMFGIRGMSQNWGFMTLSPVISSNIFNLFYGTIYDHHSIVEPNGERSCDDGLSCYRSAYVITLGACVVGLGVTLWTIHHQHKEKLRASRKGVEQD
jgi:MFS family permease